MASTPVAVSLNLPESQLIFLSDNLKIYSRIQHRSIKKYACSNLFCRERKCVFIYFYMCLRIHIYFNKKLVQPRNKIGKYFSSYIQETVC